MTRVAQPSLHITPPTVYNPGGKYSKIPNKHPLNHRGYHTLYSAPPQCTTRVIHFENSEKVITGGGGVIPSRVRYTVICADCFLLLVFSLLSGKVDEVARKHFPGVESALARPLLYSSWLSKV